MLAVLAVGNAAVADDDDDGRAGSARPGAPAAAPVSGATSLETIFDEAVAAAARGDHGTALDGFDRLVDIGVRDPDVYYNRALVHAWTGRYGEAIRDFRATLRLRPGDDAARAGVRTTLEALARRRAEREGEATVASGGVPFAGLFGFLDEPRAAVAVLVLDALLFAALFVVLRGRREPVRVGAGIAAAAFGVLLTLSAVVVAKRTGIFDPGRPAVALDDAALLEGPVAGATTRSPLPEGTSLWLLDEREGFTRVQAGGETGWLPAAVVGVVGE